MDQAESLKKHAQKIETKARAFKRLFDTQDGKLVLDALRKRCAPEMAAFVEEDPQGRKSAYWAGKQDVFFYIQSMLDVSMSDLIKITKED